MHLPVSSLAAQTRMSTQAAFVCTFSLNLLIVDLKKGVEFIIESQEYSCSLQEQQEQQEIQE